MGFGFVPAPVASHWSSTVEIEFKTKGKCFAYGMEFTIGGIKEEWLFEINSRTDKEVY